LLPALSVYHPFYAIPQVGHVKVIENTDALAAEPHVGKQLCVMNWMYCLDTLDFDHNLILYQQIKAMTQVKLFAVINYGQAKLAENL
jgi:hypothetical protein